MRNEIGNLRKVVYVFWFSFAGYALGLWTVAVILFDQPPGPLARAVVGEVAVLLIVFGPAYALVFDLVPRRLNVVQRALRRIVAEPYRKEIYDCLAIIFLTVMVAIGFLMALETKTHLVYPPHLLIALVLLAVYQGRRAGVYRALSDSSTS